MARRALSQEEADAGYRRPLRARYTHTACGGTTDITPQIAEVFARKPFLFLSAYCAHCMKHFHVSAFTWTDDGEKVGS